MITCHFKDETEGNYFQETTLKEEKKFSPLLLTACGFIFRATNKHNQYSSSHINAGFSSKYSNTHFRAKIVIVYAPINSTLQLPPPPPPSFELLKIGSFKSPPPRIKMVFKCLTISSYLSVKPFWLKNSLKAFFRNMPTQVSWPLMMLFVPRRLELLQKHNFNIETINSDLKIELIKSDRAWRVNDCKY